jgi:hypothetical protein
MFSFSVAKFREKETLENEAVAEMAPERTAIRIWTLTMVNRFFEELLW